MPPPDSKNPPPTAKPETPLTPEQVADLEAAAKKQAEGRRAIALKEIDKQGTELRSIAAKGREEAQKLRDKAAKIEAQAGDLDGAVITARDVSRHDTVRAFDILARAKAALGKSN